VTFDGLTGMIGLRGARRAGIVGVLLHFNVSLHQKSRHLARDGFSLSGCTFNVAFAAPGRSPARRSFMDAGYYLRAELPPRAVRWPVTLPNCRMNIEPRLWRPCTQTIDMALFRSAQFRFRTAARQMFEHFVCESFRRVLFKGRQQTRVSPPNPLAALAAVFNAADIAAAVGAYEAIDRRRTRAGAAFRRAIFLPSVRFE